MGKKAANAPKESAKEPAKAIVKEKEKDQKEPAAKTSGKKAKAAAKQAPAPSFLSKFRPAPRCIFFFAFVAFCAGVCGLYDPCDVKGKRKDCGFSGVSPGRCRTSECFLKGGTSIGKKTVKITRKEGASLGLVLAEGKDGYVVEEVKAGAVQEHNEAQPADSEGIIRVGTQIAKVDKVEGANMKKEVGKTKKATVELEIRVNRVPGFLMFLENKKGKPSMVEKLLTSPGSRHFASTWFFLAKIGGTAWLVSGYPIASLPTYMTISAAVSFYMSRCCHNEQVASGEPHCYKSKREPIAVVLTEAWGRIKTFSEKVSKDPRGYFDWLFLPDKKAFSFLF